MDLADIRQAIDGIDTTLLNSFVERMDIATEVAKSKIEMGKAVFDPARERSKLNNLASRAPERYEAQTITLFRLLMSMSKAEQQRYINELKGITVSQKAHATAAVSDTAFPQTATVACQGVEGAYSQIAACKLFDVPDIAFFETFEGVMRAVRDGFCEFGVLPIENSTAGSVNAIYDLMTKHNFSIVRSARLKVSHNLLCKHGVKKEDIKEIFSHQQAISQCAGYLSTLKGVKVTVVEYMPRMMPLEDEEVSKTMERAFRKLRATVLTSTTVKAVKVNAEGLCEVEIEGKKGAETLTADVVLSAVGIQSNIEGIGLEELGVAVERDKVVVDEFYRTNVPGVYAIGDIVPGPALAHVASAEAVCCVESICGLDPAPVDYTTIPSCIFTQPEVASVGMTEQQAQERGIAYKAGRFPFTASGKATAAGDRDGFVKLLFDEEGRLLGAHMVGASVTEMLAEPTLARTLGVTAHRIARTIHAHPTMNEGVMEAAEAALGAAIHL